MDYTSLSDTELVDQMHQLASQLAVAKQQKDAALAKNLYSQFQAAAQEYNRRNPTAPLANFINSVSDGVESFLRSLADVPSQLGGAVGQGVWELLRPLLPVLVLLLVAIIILVWAAGKSGAVKITKVV